MSVSKNWFVFRGERDYLHSASLFDFIVTEYASKAGAPGGIDFIFMKKSKHVCRVETVIFESEALVASYKDDHGQYYIYETEDLISKKVSYREPCLGEDFSIKGETSYVSLIDGRDSFIDLSIAAYKELLTLLFPQNNKKYIFARIQLTYIPTTSFEISYKRKISKRFFEGEITVDGAAVGLIYFGV